MIHLIKHLKGKNKGKYDIVLLSKGKVIVFSNQGYNVKQGAYYAIGSMMNNFHPYLGNGIPYLECHFQDDTVTPSVIRQLRERPKGYNVQPTKLKPHKPYQP